MAALSKLGLSLKAVSLANSQMCSAPTCQILVGLECLPKGQKACTADSLGNIGRSNIGWGNFGVNNVGYKNIGTFPAAPPASPATVWWGGLGPPSCRAAATRVATLLPEPSPPLSRHF